MEVGMLRVLNLSSHPIAALRALSRSYPRRFDLPYSCLAKLGDENILQAEDIRHPR